MSLQKAIAECEQKMKKVVESLHNELKAVRTGRASTALIENVMVECYGTMMALKQLANLAAPQADTLIIKPFDAGSIKDIEKAIKTSDLSLAPIVEGKIIRLNVPALSQERRQQLVHQAKGIGEQSKVGIRNVRRDIIKVLEKEQKDGEITEDDLEKGKKQTDNITKKYSDEVDSLIKKKSDEIMLG